MEKDKDSFNLKEMIKSVFRRASNAEREIAEEERQAKEFSEQNRKAIRKDFDRFKRR